MGASEVSKGGTREQSNYVSQHLLPELTILCKVTDALVKSSQDIGNEWKAMSKAEQDMWSEKARVWAVERRYIEDQDERKEQFKIQKEFIDDYVKDFAEKFGMSVIFCAAPAKSGTELESVLAKSNNAILTAAYLQQKDFRDTMLRNAKTPVPFSLLDQKGLDPMYREAFHDLMRESKSLKGPI